MKIEIERARLKIVLENIQDTAFVEDTLGIKEDGQEVFVRAEKRDVVSGSGKKLPSPHVNLLIIEKV